MNDQNMQTITPAASDSRPWEPLKKGDPLAVGDEVRMDKDGITRTGVVARFDEQGDPWTADGFFIGPLDLGTWYVRRTVQELPEEDGTVIVPADGHEYIEATVYGQTWRAVQAFLDFSGNWVGVWRSGAHVISSAAPGQVTPGTWKVEESPQLPADYGNPSHYDDGTPRYMN